VKGTWKQRAPKRTGPHAGLLSEFKASNQHLAAKSAGRVNKRGGTPHRSPRSGRLPTLRAWLQPTPTAHIKHVHNHAAEVTVSPTDGWAGFVSGIQRWPRYRAQDEPCPGVRWAFQRRRRLKSWAYPCR
jgi:hypothetical protein